MRFLIDAQLPPRLTRVLRRAGHEAEHVFDLGMVAKPDIEIWRHAERTGAVIITKDADFAGMRVHAMSGPAVVWLRLGNVTNNLLVQVFSSQLTEVFSSLEAGDQLVEIR